MEERKLMLLDVEVLVSGCEHCGRQPDNEEALVAVRRAQEHRKCARMNCSFCGEPVRCVSYRVRHDSEGYVAHEVKIEPSIRFNFEVSARVYEYNGLHLRCVNKALPFIKGFNEKDLLGGR